MLGDKEIDNLVHYGADPHLARNEVLDANDEVEAWLDAQMDSEPTYSKPDLATRIARIGLGVVSVILIVLAIVKIND